MESTLIQLMGDQLQLDMPKAQPGDVIVREAYRQLTEMIGKGELLGGPLLKIDGAASNLICHVIANQVSPLYETVAVKDPKLCPKGVDRFIVVSTRNQQYQVGDPIDVPRNPAKTVKLVLCGPPHSGKSCLKQGLVSAIRQLQPEIYPYSIPVCPDGEGSWFNETVSQDPEYARALKAKYKGEFTAEFIEQARQRVQNVQEPLLIVDAGGMVSDANRAILAGATHAVILAGDLEKVPEWQTFCDEQKLKTIAVIHSELHAESDRIDDPAAPVLTGRVHRLERGEDVAARPMIQALAERIVNLVQAGEGQR